MGNIKTFWKIGASPIGWFGVANMLALPLIIIPIVRSASHNRHFQADISKRKQSSAITKGLAMKELRPIFGWLPYF
jgi:hypothetical protein